MKIEVEINDLFDLSDIFEEKEVLGQTVYVIKKDCEKDLKHRVEREVINKTINTYFGSEYSWTYGQTKYDKDIKLAWRDFMEKHKDEIIENVSKRLFSSFSKKFKLVEQTHSEDV